MKNQYIGDIGDYGKYGLLRFLGKHGIKIGVNWYLTKDDGSSDGRFTSYLDQPAERIYDPELFDTLKDIAGRPDKSIKMVEDSRILPDIMFYSSVLKSNALDSNERELARRQWFNNSSSFLNQAELIFADPDNGISYKKTARTKDSEKFILPEEVRNYYNSGKNVVFYCHKGRRKSEAWEQAKIEIMAHIDDAQLLAVTCHRGTQRSYIFVLHPDSFYRYEQILKSFLKSEWGRMFTWECIRENSSPSEYRGDRPVRSQYKVITLCGSTRFKDAFMETQKRLTLEGNIVISVGLFGYSGDNEVWENMDEGTLTKTKEMLDDMHKRKIDMADEIFVINVGGYIGSSTRSEIDYAKTTGKQVRYLEETLE